MLAVLDLFSGIGGFSLGLERTGGFRTVMFCEIDPYCRAVLAKHWPDVPVHDDIRTLAVDVADARCERIPGRREAGDLAEAPGNAEGQAQERQRLRNPIGDGRSIDLICGGFPCQPFSVAGKRRGAEDDRHLWPEMLRVVQAYRPTWVIGENVAGIIPMGLDGVLADLEASGYACQAFVVPACAVDAPHRRDRVWIVAYAARDEPGRQEQRAERERTGQRSEQKPMGYASSAGQENYQGCNASAWRNGCRTADDTGGGSRGPYRWQPEPQLGRVAHGIPRRVDRLRSLGNAVVPQVVEAIGRAILEAS